MQTSRKKVRKWNDNDFAKWASISRENEGIFRQIEYNHSAIFTYYLLSGKSKMHNHRNWSHWYFAYFALVHLHWMRKHRFFDADPSISSKKKLSHSENMRNVCAKSMRQRGKNPKLTWNRFTERLWADADLVQMSNYIVEYDWQPFKILRLLKVNSISFWLIFEVNTYFSITHIFKPIVLALIFFYLEKGKKNLVYIDLSD